MEFARCTTDQWRKLMSVAEPVGVVGDVASAYRTVDGTTLRVRVRRSQAHLADGWEDMVVRVSLEDKQ